MSGAEYQIADQIVDIGDLLKWVGHARVHLVWLLGFMFFSGVANVYLIWFRRTGGRRRQPVLPGITGFGKSAG